MGLRLTYVTRNPLAAEAVRYTGDNGADIAGMYGYVKVHSRTGDLMVTGTGDKVEVGSWIMWSPDTGYDVWTDYEFHRLFTETSPWR